MAGQGLIEHRARPAGGDPGRAVADAGLDVGGHQHGAARVEGLLNRAVGAGALVQRLGLEVRRRRAHEAVTVCGRLVEETDRRVGDRPRRLADVDPRVGAVEQPVDDVAELLKHPLAVTGLAGLPANAGDKPLGGEADDGRDRHRQHCRAVLAVRIVRRSRRSGSAAGRTAPRRPRRRRADGASGCRARCGIPGSSPARWCPRSSPRRSCAGTRRRPGRAAQRDQSELGPILVAGGADGQRPGDQGEQCGQGVLDPVHPRPDQGHRPGQDGRRAEGSKGAYRRPQITYRVHAFPSVPVDDGLIGLDGWSMRPVAPLDRVSPIRRCAPGGSDPRLRVGVGVRPGRR